MATSVNQTNHTTLMPPIQDQLDTFKKNVDVFFLIVMGGMVLCKLILFNYFRTSYVNLVLTFRKISFTGRIRVL